MVGSVIVRDEQVLGFGYHRGSGHPHAEVEAINSVDGDVAGATLYCNLEPCCHRNKKTPPCTELLINKGIKRVVVCTLDPNPEVLGKGLESLGAAGIECCYGGLEREALDLNAAFFTHITTGRPFVHLKVAMTSDGKMLDNFGKSQWITGEEARAYGHLLRMNYDAVLIGRETLNRDNPSLTIRDIDNPTGKCPRRIVWGKLSKLNLDSNLFNDKNSHQTMVLANEEDPELVIAAKKYLESKKVQIVEIKQDQSIAQILSELYTLGITSLLIEGGPKIHGSFLESESFDRLSLIMAPMLVGGENGFSSTLKPLPLSAPIHLDLISTKKLGPDLLLDYRRLV
jgi:diaminohydroxyphosphoribosylaminopyrimidine deaminase/5-amino-6-(5-phosphoribosylamino)uracil reductase